MRRPGWSMVCCDCQWVSRPSRIYGAISRKRSARFAERVEHRIAHLTRRQWALVPSDEIGGSRAPVERFLHRGFDRSGLRLESERMPQQQRGAQYRSAGIRNATSGNIRR